MTYVNVGAMTPDGTRLVTKAALKRATADGSVIFDQTAVVHYDALPGYIEVGDLLRLYDQMDEAPVLSVVGPDPYSNRRWYANVKIGRDGKPTVS